jgi:hypothetical protein
VTDAGNRVDIRNRFGRVEAARLAKPATIGNSNGDIVVHDLADGSPLATSFRRIDADAIRGDIDCTIPTAP